VHSSCGKEATGVSNPPPPVDPQGAGPRCARCTQRAGSKPLPIYTKIRTVKVPKHAGRDPAVCPWEGMSQGEGIWVGVGSTPFQVTASSPGMSPRCEGGCGYI